MLFWNHHQHTVSPPSPLLPASKFNLLFPFLPLSILSFLSPLSLPSTLASFPPLFRLHISDGPGRRFVSSRVESDWFGLAIAVGSGGVLPAMSSSGSVWAGPSLDTARARPDSTLPLIRRSLHSSLFLSAADGNVNKKQSPLQTKRFSPPLLPYFSPLGKRWRRKKEEEEEEEIPQPTNQDWQTIAFWSGCWCYTVALTADRWPRRKHSQKTEEEK